MLGWSQTLRTVFSVIAYLRRLLVMSLYLSKIFIAYWIFESTYSTKYTCPKLPFPKILYN
jgi:hypothetical protein